jgi:hypothetical protein
MVLHLEIPQHMLQFSSNNLQLTDLTNKEKLKQYAAKKSRVQHEN